MDYLSDSRSPDDHEEPDGDGGPALSAPVHTRPPLFTGETLALSAGAAAVASILGTPVFQQILFILVAGQESESPLQRLFYLVGGNAIFAVTAVVLGALGRRKPADDQPRWAAALNAASIIVGAIVLALSVAAGLALEVFGPDPQDVF